MGDPSDLLRREAALIKAKKSDFAFRGYPTELNVPDYEKKVLKCTSVTLDATWLELLARTGCGALRVNEAISHFGLRDLDGVSGSPVFSFQRTAAGILGKFAGVIIKVGREDFDPQLVRFIEARVVFLALETICGLKPRVG